MVIRRHPTDFVVTEVLTPEASASIAELPGPGRVYAVYLLEKESLSTPEATRRLAAEIGVGAGEVSWAGLKDKHAVTTQHVTVPVRRDPMATRRRVEAQGLRATLVGWSFSEAEASWVLRNRFVIVVRGVAREDAARMVSTIEERQRASGGSSILVLNAFGEQRFGSARHGRGFAARSLVEGRFEDALRLLIATPARKETGTRRTSSRVLAEKWGRWVEAIEALPRGAERRAIEVLARGGNFREAFESLPHLTKQMCVESYQSYLWNRIVERVAGAASVRELEGLSIDLPGPEATYTERIPAIAREVLDADGLTLEGLRIPGVRRPVFGSPARPVVVRAESIVVSEPEPDEANRWRVTLGFELPRGAYATVLLRSLEA
jgi:tRNA pseudouridine13 synthase